MKIVITGINGLLGSALVEVLRGKHELIGLTNDISAFFEGISIHTVDICDQKLIYTTLTKINPDLVIHTAAYTDVDGCEKNTSLAYQVNAIGTRNIALACQRFDTEMLHISTDYVFSGLQAPKAGYTEIDKTEPISFYGKSKLAGEMFVKDLLTRFYIVRISWLFGHGRRNYIDHTYDSLKNSKSMKAVTDMVANPTYAKDLSIAIAQLIETGRYGVYHITNTGGLSRYALSLELAKMFNLSSEMVEKSMQKDLPFIARRPEFSIMQSMHWELGGFRPMRDWKEAVKEYIQEKNDKE